MNKFILISILSVCLAFASNSNAQVTIGSDVKPQSGALLELREFPTKANGATSTKGLMLPRVELSDTKSLTDMNGVNAAEHILHTGLMAYNVSIDKCNNLAPGVYLWNGEEWNRLGNGVVYKTGQLEDSRDNDAEYTYMTAHFIAKDPSNATTLVDAGEWMLENLKAKTYATGLTGNKQTLVFNDGSTAPLATDAYYAYPNNDQSRFEVEGYFYSGIAALNNNLVDGIYNAAGPETPPSRNQQGICPDGWRIPTYEDWMLLKNVIEKSEIENNGCEFTFPKPDTGKALGGLILAKEGNPNYTSRPAASGGFAAMESGSYGSNGAANSEIGTKPAFITTYPVPVQVTSNPETGSPVTKVHPMYGAFSFTDSDKYSQFHTSPSENMPVRCVKRAIPDQDTTIYDSRHSFCRIIKNQNYTVS